MSDNCHKRDHGDGDPKEKIKIICKI